MLPCRCSLLPLSSLFKSALNPFAGGRLEFHDVFFGFFSNRFCNFCISSHSSTIKASFPSSVSCFKLGSSFILSLYHFLTLVYRNLPELSNYDLTDNPNGLPSRWIIDFQDMQLEEVSSYKLPFQHVKTFVKPERIENREAVLHEKWWRFKRTNDAMRKAFSNLLIYFVVPRHSKWFVFLPVPTDWLPADSTTVFASDNFYVLGTLTSKVHRQMGKNAKFFCPSLLPHLVSS
jgi:hypothetical protein